MNVRSIRYDLDNTWAHKTTNGKKLIEKTPHSDVSCLSTTLKAASLAGRHIIDFFKNEEWMRGIVDGMGIATMCVKGAKVVPIINIVSSPLYLYHAITNTQYQFRLVKLSFLTNQVSKAVFWGGRAIDALGTALSDIVQPFAGGAELLGLTNAPAVAVIFSIAIPIILIVFGAVGGLWETWAMTKTARALKDFNKKLEEQDGSVEKLAELLSSLRSINLEAYEDSLTVESAKKELQKLELEDTHFSSSATQQAIQRKIEDLFSSFSLQSYQQMKAEIIEMGIGEKMKALGSDLEGVAEKPETANTIAQLNELARQWSRLTSEAVTLKNIEETELHYEKLIKTLRDPSCAPLCKDHEMRKTLLDNLENCKSALTSEKNAFLQSGFEILEEERSELHRKMVIHVITIIMAALTLASGVLYLSDPRYEAIAAALGISCSALDVLFIIFNKCVSEKCFHEWDRFLENLVHERSLKPLRT